MPRFQSYLRLLRYSLMHGSVIFPSVSHENCAPTPTIDKGMLLKASPCVITIIRQWHTQLYIDMHGCYIGV